MIKEQTNKQLREALLAEINSFSAADVAKFLKIPEHDLSQVLRKNRDSAVLKYVISTQTSKRNTNTICWDCVHCTNRYRTCSWSRELKPRDDWEPGDYEKIRQASCVGISTVVKNCKGFEVESDLACRRGIIEAVLKDFFKNCDCVQGKFFTKIKLPEFKKWLEAYNKICKTINIKTLKLRESSN